MIPKTLEQWLAWQETLHPAAIALGLERCHEVVGRLHWPAPPFAVFAVAGTNGKGSVVAMLESILLAAGYRTCAYTSPHLLRYNERVRLNGRDAADQVLCEAFSRVEEARGGVPLTYFEYGTLAALDVFFRTRPDAAILEVGLGGRLDAVNVLDADAAVVTTVAMDHMQWLGNDREAIGREKAGIFRRDRPAVIAEPDPPASLLAAARDVGALPLIAGRDFRAVPGPGEWAWYAGDVCQEHLPLPGIAGDFQIQNAGAVLAALWGVRTRLPVAEHALRQGLADARLAGRLQILGGPVERILDVAHNPQAAAALGGFLRRRRCAGRTRAVVGMLADKDLEGVLGAVGREVDRWHPAALAVPRGAPAQQLAAALSHAGLGDALAACADGVPEAYASALEASVPGDRVVVFGSFHTVAAVLALESS